MTGDLTVGVPAGVPGGNNLIGTNLRFGDPGIPLAGGANPRNTSFGNFYSMLMNGAVAPAITNNIQTCESIMLGSLDSILNPSLTNVGPSLALNSFAYGSGTNSFPGGPHDTWDMNEIIEQQPITANWVPTVSFNGYPGAHVYGDNAFGYGNADRNGGDFSIVMGATAANRPFLFL